MTLALEPLLPALSVAAAFALDARLGEPPTRMHPVVWIGNAARPLTHLRPRGKHLELLGGGLYALSVACGFAGLGALIVHLLAPWPWARWGFEAYVLFGCFAVRGLLEAGQRMHDALARGDVTESRAALRSLCSRDASELSPSELAGATIESLTENTSDSIVAPLFYYVLFGVPGVLFYRAANTLDAMVGYHGRYEYLGKVAARLDDLLNFIPARLTARVLLAASVGLGLPMHRGFAVWRRDARNTESPNAGHPMAMAAGLLGVRLDKRSAYVLGAELAAPNAQTLELALRLVRRAGRLAVAISTFVLIAWGVLHATRPG